MTSYRRYFRECLCKYLIVTSVRYTSRKLLLIVFLVLLPTLCTGAGQTVPIWNTYKWGSNFLSWCRFRCAEKINAGNIFKVDFSGPTRNFTGFDNLKILKVEGPSYIVETNFDIWGDGGFCQFQFGLRYTGINLKGNCSFYELTDPSLKQPSGQDLAMRSNTKPGPMWRFRGRCSVPCKGQYNPQTLRVRIVLDKASTNFSAYDRYMATVPSDTLSRTWTVVNQNLENSDMGLCHFDFQFEHQSEFPVPKGTCEVL